MIIIRLVSSACKRTELHNVKYFAQINSFEMNLPLEKSAYIITNCRPKMHEMGKKGKFKGKTTKDDIIETVLKTKRHVSC